MLLKMDVEGAEWDALMATPDDVLRRIDQIAMELHGVNHSRYLAAIKRLRQHFYVVNFHVNNQSCAPNVAPFLPGSAIRCCSSTSASACSTRRHRCRRRQAP